MKPILVLYATREGHTRRIAEFLAASVRLNGGQTTVVNAADFESSFQFDDFSGAFVAASVHQGYHEKELVQFVKRHLAALSGIPSVFFSVSLSQAGAEDATASPEHRAKASGEVQKMIDVFLQETGWCPTIVKPVAGALMYTKYNFLIRFIMKRIARKERASTDTSKDHEFTNWVGLHELVQEFVKEHGLPGFSRAAHG